MLGVCGELAIHSVSTNYLPAIREQLVATTGKMLSNYRRHCAGQIDSGQVRCQMTLTASRRAAPLTPQRMHAHHYS